MRSDIIESWIESLTERQFYRPFHLILRYLGFYDIHNTHGQFEFGKDFIAKKVEDGEVIQYAFQVKSGDIGGPGWNSIVGQLHELPNKRYVHPNFNKEALLKCCLVLTGVLKGKAGLSATLFAEALKEKEGVCFEIWTKERMIEFLMEIPEILEVSLAGNDLEHYLNLADSKSSSILNLSQELEAHSMIMDSSDKLIERLLELNILEYRFFSREMPFHSLIVLQHACRIALAFSIKNKCPPTSGCLFNELLEDWIDSSREVGERFSELTPMDLFEQSSESSAGSWVAYPYSCFLEMETLAVATLGTLCVKNDTDGASKLATQLSEFIKLQSGCRRPLSDWCAASLIPVTIALELFGHTATAVQLLRSITKWLCDLYESESGMEGPHAGMEKIIRRIFGSRFSFLEIDERRESFLAALIADLSYIFFPTIYPKLINEFKAVGLVLSHFHARDEVETMFVTYGQKVEYIVNIDYPDTITGNELLPHHKIQMKPRKLEMFGGSLGTILISLLCRDRLFSDAIGRILNTLRVQSLQDRL